MPESSAVYTLHYLQKQAAGSISKRLGHSRVSTTTDYYSHMLKDADDISAETIANVMLRHKGA